MVRSLVLVLLIGSALGSVQAQHPFYVQLLEDGRNAMVLEQWERAHRFLEIAAFGMMDEPSHLSEIYVRLAVLQGYLGDQEKRLKYRSKAVRFLGSPAVRPPALSEPEWQSWLELNRRPITEQSAFPSPAPTAATPVAAPSRWNLSLAKLDDLIQNKRTRKARKLLAALLEERPADTGLLTRAVVFAANQDQGNNASVHARRLLELDPSSSVANEYLGNQAVKNNRYQPARAHYEQMTTPQLNATAAMQAQLNKPAPKVTRRVRNDHSAEREAAVPAKPAQKAGNPADEEFEAIDNLLANGDPAKAKKALRRMSKTHLNDPRYARSFSHYNYLKKEYGANVKHLQGTGRMLDQTRYYLGMSHYQLGSWREAEQVLRRLDRDRFPDLNEVDDKIRKALTGAAAQAPAPQKTKAAAPTPIGITDIAAAVAADDWETAAKAVTRAYAANPTDPDTRYFRARLLLHEGNYRRASQLFYNLVSNGYKDREVYYYGGLAAQKAGDEDLASYLFGRAEVAGTRFKQEIQAMKGSQEPKTVQGFQSTELELLKSDLEGKAQNGGDIESRLSLLRVYLMTGDSSGFDRIMDQLKGMPLTREQADVMQGWQLFHFGQYDRAGKTVDSYENDEALFLRGLLFHHRGMPKKALPLLGRLKGSPRFPEVDLLLKQQIR